MKYTIYGKPAYKVAKKNGISPQVFYRRVRTMSVKLAVAKKNYHYTHTYRIKRGDVYLGTFYSTQQVANYLGTSKNTICGLFYKKGNKIKLLGYTCTRINKGGKNETTESL